MQLLTANKQISRLGGRASALPPFQLTDIIISGGKMSEYKQKNPVPKNFQKNNDIITGPKGLRKTEKEVIAPVINGAIGTAKAPIVPKVQESKPKPKEVEKVAVHSTRNVYWPGVGKVSKGYNIVKRDAAEMWLTRNHIREATPEEVAREFGL
jgi:hypothetical protein